MPEPRSFPWSVVAILALSVGIGWLLVSRPPKLSSAPLPAELQPGGPLVLEVLAQHDGPEGATKILRRDADLPIGARIRLQVTLTETTTVTLGIKPPTGAWRPALSQTRLPPGIHTIHKTFVVEGEGLEAWAGTPEALEALAKGEPSPEARRLKIRGVLDPPR